MPIQLYTVDDVMSADECGGLIALMDGHLRPSTVTPTPGVSDFRTSRTCDFKDHPRVRALDARLCAIVSINAALGEPLQGQHYDIGQQFKEHTDYFESYELETYSTPIWGQRTWTAMVYLNEPKAGGATTFPLIDLILTPRTGRVVCWNNLLPSGAPNPATLHASLPVIDGYKVVVTKWFRMPSSLLRGSNDADD